MVLQFASYELRDSCEKIALAKTNFGPSVADSVLAAVADLASAPTLGDLPENLLSSPILPNKPFLYDYGSCSLLIVVNHRDPPVGQNGEISLGHVTRVRINEVITNG